MWDSNGFALLNLAAMWLTIECCLASVTSYPGTPILDKEGINLRAIYPCIYLNLFDCLLNREEW